MASPDTPTSAWRERWDRLVSRGSQLPLGIAASPVVAVATPVHENQRVEKSFTISKPAPDASLAAERGVDTLHVCAPRLTIVRVRPELLKEIGPDVVALVRVSSDAPDHLERFRVQLSSARALALGYDTPAHGTEGHLVTEIDVAHADQVHRVVATGHSDVVVQDGVFGATFARSTPALVSLVGARLAVAAPRRDVACNDLVVGCVGSGRVDVDVAVLKTTTLFAAGVLGRGHVGVNSSYFASNVTLCTALGDGTTLLTAQDGFSSPRLVAHQRGGGGTVRILPGPDANVATCLTQRIRASSGGLVDCAAVPSYTTLATVGGTVRLQVPHRNWWNPSLFRLRTPPQWRATHPIIQHVGVLPASFASAFPHATFEQLDGPHSELALPDTTAPTIERAFERSTALGGDRWLWKVLAPVVQSLL